jgi:excisionase family DNA binding protein
MGLLATVCCIYVTWNHTARHHPRKERPMAEKPNLPDPEFLISKREAAERLGVATMTIDRAINKGKLHKYILPNGYNVLLDVREVDALPVWRPVTGPRN